MDEAFSYLHRKIADAEGIEINLAVLFLRRFFLARFIFIWYVCDRTLSRDNIMRATLGRIFVILSIIVFVIFTGGIFSGVAAQYDVAGDQNCNSTCRKIREIDQRARFVVFIAVVPAGKPLPESIGSGILINQDSFWFVISNSHVIPDGGGYRIWISFRGVPGFTEAELVGRDHGADLALLSVKDLPRNVEAAELAEKMEVGQQLYAAGYPFGNFDISVGYVNAVESFSWLYAWSQAPVNPGSSGGPVLNEKLQVAGINTAIISGNVTPKSLVIPVEYIKRLLPRLRREKLVQHGALGFEFVDGMKIVPSFFEVTGFKPGDLHTKIIATKIPPDSGAMQAGIQQGDALIAFNGIRIRSAKELSQRIFFDYRPGEIVSFTIERAGQLYERKLTLAEYRNPIASSSAKKD